MGFPFLRNHLFRILLVFVAGMLALEFYVFLLVSRERRMEREKRFVRDYEPNLCSFSLSRRKAARSTRECPAEGIVTSFKHGGLSNVMWQYGNVIAASVVTGMEAFVPVCMRDALAQVFANVSVPLLSEVGHCRIPLTDSASSVADWSDRSQCIVITNGGLYNDAVIRHMDVVRDHFEFAEPLAKMADDFLRAAKGSRETATYVGVYITETNVIVNQETDDVYPSVQFFRDALDVYRRDVEDALFVVIADQEPFWRSVLSEPDVETTAEALLPSYGATLAILSRCNHTVLASNGFAVWAAILTRGRAVLSLSVSDDFIALTQQYPDWTFLVNNTGSNVGGGE